VVVEEVQQLRVRQLQPKLCNRLLVCSVKQTKAITRAVHKALSSRNSMTIFAKVSAVDMTAEQASNQKNMQMATL
jgi:hypothetical protein